MSHQRPPIIIHRLSCLTLSIHSLLPSLSWCPPCKQIAPVYEELSKKYDGVAFGKVDVDDNSDAALDFEIAAVPTFVLFDGEKAIDKFSGADPAKLEEKVVDLQGR